MDYKVNLFFPCDFEDKDEERSKLYVSEFCKGRNLRYSSPIFSINDEPLKCINDHISLELKQQSKDTANDILKSCRLIDEKRHDLTLNDKFLVNEVFYPYGVSVRGELSGSEVVTLIERIENVFTPFRQPKQNQNITKKPIWIIYERPILVLELNSKTDLSTLPKKLSFKKLSQFNNVPNIEYAASNDTIVVNNINEEAEFTQSLYSVLAVLIALKKLSSSVRIKSKQASDDSERNDIQKRVLAMEIHQACAVFDEINNKNIFYKRQEQEMFEILSSFLCVHEQHNQIKSSRENVDYLLDVFIDKKTKYIEESGFFTVAAVLT